MKLKYLGTAAAEGIPAIFCECENCQKAREWGGKNLRTRSQALIDGKMFIDYPADTYWHLSNYNIDIVDVPNCLITHTHQDHFYPEDMRFLKSGFSHPPRGWRFNLYGSIDVEKELKDLPKHAGDKFKYNKIKAFEPFCVENYTVTALKATHGTENPFVYMISDGEKTLLYAHDTDIFPEETWRFLRETKPYFNLVSLDCTEGAEQELPYKGHMCLGINIKCRSIMNEMGLTDLNTKFVLNHFSHNGLSSTYNEFSVLAEKEDFIVSYDGMEIEI